MRLQESREAYADLTEKASEISRQLAFASIGIVWVFKESGPASVTLPRDLVWPALTSVLALFLDLLHYVLSAAIWGAYHRRKVSQLALDETRDFYPPRIVTLPGEVLFWCKLIAVGVAYVGLGLYSKRLLH
jgi:hypothetical protein